MKSAILVESKKPLVVAEIDLPAKLKFGQVLMLGIDDEYYFYYSKISIKITDELHRSNLHNIRSTYPLRKSMKLETIKNFISSYDDKMIFLSNYYKTFIRKQKIKRIINE